jgi:hypothetical protein
MFQIHISGLTLLNNRLNITLQLLQLPKTLMHLIGGSTWTWGTNFSLPAVMMGHNISDDMMIRSFLGGVNVRVQVRVG